jgi:hypothetical protein
MPKEITIKFTEEELYSLYGILAPSPEFKCTAVNCSSGSAIRKIKVAYAESIK